MSGSRDRGAGCRAPAVALALASGCVALLPLPAKANWKAFIPRPIENHAYVDTYTSFERDHSSGADDFEWTDTFLRERLTLQSYGYSYHPRFMRYQLSLSGSTTQEDYRQSSGSDPGWRTGTGLEYDTRLAFLPEHPYNMILFASRYEPVYKQQASSSHNSVADTYGGTVRYRKKPYFFNTTYIDTTLDSDTTKSHTRRLGVDGEYFKRFLNGYEFSLTGAYNPSWYDDSDDLDGTSNEYLGSATIDLNRARLFSSVTKNQFDQTRGAGDSYDADQFTWYEVLSVDLPLNLRSDVSYRLYDNTSDVESVGQPAQHYSDDGDRWQLDLEHRLYNSLDTTYTLLSDKHHSGGGKTDLFSNSLGVNYTKSIPYGFIETGLSLGRADTDNKGFADVVNDPYTSVAVPGSFVLRQQDVNPSTIVVFLRSPLPPFDAILLTENVNYRVVPFLNTFEIQILTLPPEFAVPGTYDFFVNYSLTSGDYELRSDTLGTTFSLPLFDNLLTPYFNYVGVRSKVLSGDFPGDPVDSDTYTTGVVVHHGPWRVRGEYQDVNWDVNPFWSYQSELQYVGALSDSLTLYSSVSYLTRHYEGSSGTFDNPSYTEDTLTTAGTIQKRIFLRNMYLSLGGSYSHLDGQVTNDAWTVNSAFVWTIGKLTLSAGVSAYGSETNGLDAADTSRDHELIYLSLRRQLL